MLKTTEGQGRVLFVVLFLIDLGGSLGGDDTGMRGGYGGTGR